MKRGPNLFILCLVVVAGIYVGVGRNHSNHPQALQYETDATFVTENELHDKMNNSKAEDAIKKEFDSHMFDDVGNIFKTSRYSYIAATGAVINDKEKLFIIQAKEGDEKKAASFFDFALGYFNNTNLKPKYRVDTVMLVDHDFKIEEQMDTRFKQ
ncbi:hypothetical protein QUF84_09415 [Fictibacillus enclensis]|uniref:hypothetical protein n=1 Tax=Fictibacillus enclensis TaxID=1017270 RepID=UPI0025A3044D|nr:hypothetical protein [Fictibacillus enclensis]MDM5337432.1 hypothetical protein [Fictibacillus enclensis]